MPPPPSALWGPSHIASSRLDRPAKKKRTSIAGQYDGTDDNNNSLFLDEEPEEKVDNSKEGKKEDDESLDSDLDDEEEQEPETDNLVLCQFEKIARIKNKRKCTLKDGIMVLNGRNYMFSKAIGECEF